MDKEILKEMGLTDYEIDIYITLLQYGQISAYELAEKIGLYRQVIYDTLNRLIEKGFVNSVKEGKSKLYKAANPNLVLEYLNEKVENYKQLLPELNKLEKESKEPLIIETYKGKNITRIALRDIINNLKEKGGEVLCTAIDESIPLSKNKLVLDQYERDIIHYNIKEKVIIKEGNKGIFQKGNSRYKKIPVRFFNQNPIQIYRNNVQLIIWGNPDYLVIMRGEDVAEAYRKQFELLWKTAKK